jgi:hypothetical protein
MFYVTIFHWNGFLNAKLYDHTRLEDSAVDKFRRNARKISLFATCGSNHNLSSMENILDHMFDAGLPPGGRPSQLG